MSEYSRGAVRWTLIGLFGGPVFFFVLSGELGKSLLVGIVIGPPITFLNHNLFYRLFHRKDEE